MYNKLFTKILDSTIWLESDATRIVWITLIAAMDEIGFVPLSSLGNVAARARVSLEDAAIAITTLESPDTADPNQENEGRRIERVPSGWMVLNSSKYRDLVRRESVRMMTRERVRRHREKKAGNAHVTLRNEMVAQSDTDTETLKAIVAKGGDAHHPPPHPPGFTKFWESWPRTKRKGGRQVCLRIWTKKKMEPHAQKIIDHVEHMKASRDWREGFEPKPATYLNAQPWDGAETDAPEPGEKPWYLEWSTIIEKGLQLGLHEEDFPSPPAFRAAVFKCAGITTEQFLRAEADWSRK